MALLRRLLLPVESAEYDSRCDRVGGDVPRSIEERRYRTLAFLQDLSSSVEADLREERVSQWRLEGKKEEKITDLARLEKLRV